MSSIPVPQGKYVPATRQGDLIFTAGMTPRVNGKLLESGKILSSREAEAYGESIRQAARNTLAAARSLLKDGECIAKLLSVTVFVNAEEGYSRHTAIADLASAFYCEELGEAGICARASVGVASLPGNAPCEIQLIAAAGPEKAGG